MLLLIACCLVAGCGDDTSTRVCFGSTAFCDGAFTRNRSPEADAGPDLEVAAGDRVTLDGSESRDPDGGVNTYSWSQESGPSVALSQATASVAAFDAPDVEEQTTLVFRLVVTDDDGASDSDSVSVVVTPAAVSALRRDVAQLERMPPQPCVEESKSTRCWSYMGLWLGARVSAAQALDDVDSTALLDALRVIEITHAQVPPPDVPDAQRTLFELGQRAVAAFTAERDPATAERARQVAAGPPPRAADWQAAIEELDRRSGLDRAAERAAGTLLQALRLRGDPGRAGRVSSVDVGSHVSA